MEDDEIYYLEVNSSHIASARYIPSERHPNHGELHIQYKDADGVPAYLYKFRHVHENTWFGFRAAKSKGVFVNSQVRGKYKYSRHEASDVRQYS